MATYSLYQLVEATEALPEQGIELKQLGFVVDINPRENADTVYGVDFIIIGYTTSRKRVEVTENQIKLAKAE